jgi:MoxR-like ATPase
MTLASSWWIYSGARTAPDPSAIDRRPEPPPWRTFRGLPIARALDEASSASTFRPLAEEVELVNAALLLRRPLLVTGKPGCGKSSLAKSIAWELGLGSLLTWPINTRTTLTDGLYRYDAIARLQDASLPRAAGARDAPEIARYLRLGPLGEALLPTARPRVLLIDEIDKSDVDLPNDLLHVLEEGRFEIPELTRLQGTGARLAARAGPRRSSCPRALSSATPSRSS